MEMTTTPKGTTMTDTTTTTMNWYTISTEHGTGQVLGTTPELACGIDVETDDDIALMPATRAPEFDEPHAEAYERHTGEIVWVLPS